MPVMVAGQEIEEGVAQKIRHSLAAPNRFIPHFLRTSLWEKQRQIVDSVFTHRRTAVKSCHSSGKTHVAAAIGLAFLARYKEAAVITTAPTGHQVEKLLWGEVHKLIGQSIYPWPKPLTIELKMGPKRWMYGISTRVEKQDEGVKLQGIHAENVLIILDEAPGVDPKLQEAAEAALASGNAHILEIGNPTVASGGFHKAFTKDRRLWNTFTISAFDTPNLKGLTIDDLLRLERDDPEELERNQLPYLATRRWVLDMYHKFGLDHPFYQSRVLGNFPTQSEDSLFSLEWLERNRQPVARPDTSRLKGGLDVAGPGENETVLVLFDGPNLVHRKSWTASDPRGAVAAELRPFLQREQLVNINVDSIGIGWYMYCHLRDEGFPVSPINVGEPADDPEKYLNKKAELYWSLRTDSQNHEIGGFDDEEIGQLSSIRYEHTPKGLIKIESKEDMLKRGVESPDKAEAIMLARAAGLDVWANL